MAKAVLNPPCPYWREDLPHPHETPMLEKDLGNQPPNHQDPIYLEITRSTVTHRNISLLLTLKLTFMLPALSGMIFVSLELAPFTLLCYIFLGYSCFYQIRLYTSPPIDEPLRFNRARQKIYAYNFKFSQWNALSENWGIWPVSYDWAQVRAERWMKFTKNGDIHGVTLSIVEPGTHNVIDRFILSLDGANEHAWAYICTYMQEGPAALPPPEPAKDHDDILWCELAFHLAPKVHWPAAMDLESRTAP